MMKHPVPVRIACSVFVLALFSYTTTTAEINDADAQHAAIGVKAELPDVVAVELAK